MAILNPTQNQLATQSLQKWVEKVAANANTAELDALELVQLQSLLQTIISTHRTPYKEILVNRDIVITDNIFGVVRLTVPVTLVEDVLTIKSITADASNDNKIRFLITFLPDNTITAFTYANAVSLFNTIKSSLVPFALPTTKEEFETLDYLNSIGSNVISELCIFCLDVDFKTNETKFEIKFSAYPSIESPVLTNPTITDLTADTAKANGRFDYTGRRIITEVGAILSQEGEEDVIVPASSVESPFVASITNLVDDVVYEIKTYVKFSDGEVVTSNAVDLEGKDLPNVISVAAADITTTTATLGGTFVYNAEEGVGAITETGVEYKIDGGVYAAVAAAGLTSPISVGLTELTLGSKYFYKAYVAIGATKYYGAELSFDTLAE